MFKSVGNTPLKKTTKKLYFPYEIWTLVNKESINITLLRSLLGHITIDFFQIINYDFLKNYYAKWSIL